MLDCFFCGFSLVVLDHFFMSFHRILLGYAFCVNIALSALGAPEVLPVAGWKMEMIAEAPEVLHPSVICSAPDGRIFVAEDPMDIRVPVATPQGRIICIHSDGRKTVFAENLHAVFGMQYLEGRLFVLHNPFFTVFQDDNGVGKDREDLLKNTNPNPWALDWNDHVPANFKLAMDGFFYLAVGDKGIFGAVGRDGRRIDLQGGGILRLRPDGTEMEVYSTGVRNILDVGVNSEDAVFTYDNTDEHDWMGRLTHMVEGGFYGYPHDFVPRQPHTLWMMHDFGGGAATGVFANTEDGLPDSYKENLFLADFGKRQILRVVTEEEGATYRVVHSEELFLDPPPEFRPVGIAQSADGKSILICDWAHRDTKEDVKVGRVWKLTSTGLDSSKPKPNWFVATAMGKPCLATDVQLGNALNHSSKNVRLCAQRELVRRKSHPIVANILNDSSSSGQALMHAIWAADAMDHGVTHRQAIKALLESKHASVRQHAIRQLGTRRVGSLASAVEPLLTDPRQKVQFEAATALGRMGQQSSIDPLMSKFDEKDSFTRFATFTALNRIGHNQPATWSKIASVLNHKDSRFREGAFLALRETSDIALAGVLRECATNESWTTEAQLSAFRLLTGMLRKYPAWNGEWGAYHPALAPRPIKTENWEGTMVISGFLKSQITNPSEDLRLAAVEGTRVIGGESGARQLEAAFSLESVPKVKQAILRALVDLKDSNSDTLFARVLTEQTESEILEIAVQGVAATRGKQGTESLLRRLSAGLPLNAELQGIRVLGELHLAEALPFLHGKVLSPTAADSIRIAALKAVGEIPGEPSAIVARTLLDHPSVAIRKAAITALGNLRDQVSTLAILKQLGKEGTETVVYEALLRLADVRALDAYLKGLASANPSVRDSTRKAMESIKGKVLENLQQRGSGLEPGVLVELRKIYEKDEQALKSPIFVEQVKVLEPTDFEAYALANKGDPLAGQRFFWDEAGVACLKCHQVAGLGGMVGPDLTLIGVQFPKAVLIEHILYPSRVVREGYQAYSIELKGGESVSGLVKGEDAKTITVLDSSGKMVTIPKEEVLTRSKSGLSLMPEGLHVGLTLKQFTDLIAFLESRRSDARQSAKVSNPDGFKPVFDGRSLEGWNQEGKEVAHWSVKDGVLENDGMGEQLWSNAKYLDFVFRFQWRLPDPPKWNDLPVINLDGTYAIDEKGKPITQRVLDAGAGGVLFRSSSKANVDLSCYPIGSGGLWDSREDPQLTAQQRKAMTPKRQADRPVGDWNAMEIRMQNNQLTVLLNAEEVISAAELPSILSTGSIGLQGKSGRVQFRHMFISEGR